MLEAPLISVIDDDESVRLSVEALVRCLGHEARSFGSAEAFLESATLGGCACIVCDVMLPGMSGIDLQHRLRAMGIATPVILMTAFPSDFLRGRAEKAGALCFLAKPFDARSLIDCLERVVGT